LNGRNHQPTTRGKAAQETRGEATLAHIGLGSNLGDRVAAIREALAQLDAQPGIEVLRTSRLYETEPVGPVEQGRFINAVAELETSLSARELLAALLAIEARLGRERERGERWGPRTIDLDLLLLDDLVLDEPDLIVPHPELAQRPFVLVPLCELIPDARHPGLGRTFGELRDELGAADGVVALPPGGDVSQR